MCNIDIKIEDLVLYDSEPAIVLELNANYCTIELVNYNRIESDISYEEIEPIPLTAEILKKIGWKLGFNYYWESPASALKLYYDDIKYLVYYDFNSDIAFDALAPIADIKYVHELQHLIWILENGSVICQ